MTGTGGAAALLAAAACCKCKGAGSELEEAVCKLALAGADVQADGLQPQTRLPQLARPKMPQLAKETSDELSDGAGEDGQRGVPGRMATAGQRGLHHHPDGWCPGNAERTLRQPQRGRQSDGDERPGGAPQRSCATLHRRRTGAPLRSGPKTCLTAGS